MQIWLFEVVFFRVDEEVAFNGSLISLYTVRYIYIPSYRWTLLFDEIISMSFRSENRISTRISRDATTPYPRPLPTAPTILFRYDLEVLTEIT